MNKIGLLLDDLHDAETDLAAEWRTIGERHAAEHDMYYIGHTLAKQCDAHAERVREIGENYGKELSEPHGQSMRNVLSGIRQKTSALLGRESAVGLLLLRDLRQLYLMAEEVNVHWIALGQVAQAVRDEELLDTVTKLHKETLTQIKWLKTRIKQAVPQILVVA
jgi:hypothetical protein